MEHRQFHSSYSMSSYSSNNAASTVNGNTKQKPSNKTRKWMSNTSSAVKSRQEWNKLMNLLFQVPCCAESSRDESSRNDLLTALRGIQLVHLPCRSISNVDYFRLLEACTSRVPQDDEECLRVCFETWYHVMRSSSAAGSFGAQQLKVLMEFFIEILQVPNPQFQPSIDMCLRCLGHILFENGERCVHYHDEILAILRMHCKNCIAALDAVVPNGSVIPSIVENAAETLSICSVCLGNLFFREGAKVETTKSVNHLKFFDELLQKQIRTHWKQILSSHAYARLLSCVLRALNSIIESSPTQAIEQQVELVPALHGLFQFQMRKISRSIASQSVSPRRSCHAWSDLSDDSNPDGSCSRYDSSTEIMSDSDKSVSSYRTTSDLGQNSSRNYAQRVRYNAIQCIGCIAQNSPKLIQRYWYLLLPEVQALHPIPVRMNLVTVLLFDTVNKCREAAAECLPHVVRALPLQRWLGTHQSHSVGVSSSSMSSRIAAMVLEVHKAINRALSQADSARKTKIILACCVLLSEMGNAITSGAFPADDLRGCVTQLQRFLRPSIDTNVSVPVMQCIGNLLSKKEACNVLAPFMLPSSLWQSARPCKDAPEISLIDALLHIANNGHSSPARHEAFAVLAKASRHHAGAMSASWIVICPLVVEALADSSPLVRNNSLKVLEEMLRARAANVSSADAAANAFNRRPSSLRKVVTQIPGNFPELEDHFGLGLVAPWFTFHEALPESQRLSLTSLVVNVLSPALSDSNAQVRATALMCLSYLMPVDWARLIAAVDGWSAPPRSWKPSATGIKLRDKIFAIAVAACSDSATAVRCASCRMFGAYGCFRDWKISGFVRLSVPALLKCVSDGVLSVRLRAVWAVSNICTTPDAALDATTTAATIAGLIAPTVDSLSALLQEAKGSSTSDTNTSSHQSQSPISLRRLLTPNRFNRGISNNNNEEPLLLSQFVPLEQVRELVAALVKSLDDNDKVAGSAARTLGLCVKGLVEHMYPVDAYFVASKHASGLESPYKNSLGKYEETFGFGVRENQDPSAHMRKLLTPPPEVHRKIDIVGSDEKASFVGAGRVAHISSAESPFVRRLNSPVNDVSKSESNTALSCARNDQTLVSKAIHAWHAGLVPRATIQVDLLSDFEENDIHCNDKYNTPPRKPMSTLNISTKKSRQYTPRSVPCTSSEITFVYASAPDPDSLGFHRPRHQEVDSTIDNNTCKTPQRNSSSNKTPQRNTSSNATCQSNAMSSSTAKSPHNHENHLANEWAEDHRYIGKAMRSIAQCVTNGESSAKTRWNSCYALHFVMPLTQILLNAQARWKLLHPSAMNTRQAGSPSSFNSTSPNQPELFQRVPGPDGSLVDDVAEWATLGIRQCISALENDVNFKVRIAAVQVISAVPTRVVFADAFESALRTLVLSHFAFDMSGAAVINSRYIGSLMAALRHALLHVIACSKRQDLAAMKDLLFQYAADLATWLEDEYRRCHSMNETGEPDTAPVHFNDTQLATGQPPEQIAFSREQVQMAASQLCKMYDSRVKTISSDILEQFRQLAACDVDNAID